MTTRTQKSRYLVGIDLGTTHTAVAYSDTSTKENPGIELLQIDQLVAEGEIARRPLLPSVRYHPAEGEMADTDIGLPWSDSGFSDPVKNRVIGELARVISARSHGRTVTSAKSWLSHTSVDRDADILPWGAPDGVAKVSPVVASASYLAHVRGAWNTRFPDAPLEQQEITVTIPASFDDSARALTVEAAKMAGLPRVRLLEEPQAVCYDWLWRHRAKLEKSLQDIRLLMVCDIGGGTSDFTLISIRMDENEPRLTRIGVGDHLMLGGDNIDLALAHLAENKVSRDGSKLSSSNLYQLIEQCRAVKERMLGEKKIESANVTLLGSGSRLVGGAKTVELLREEVEEIVLAGFFPNSGFNELPDRKRSGMVEFGLSYVADPAICKHIAAFLHRHRNAMREALDSSDEHTMPDAILLNGGMFKSRRITSRLLEVVSAWRRQPLQNLKNPQPELAVAYGAVASGMSRRGEHVKIGGGSARSYFLQVADRKNRTRNGVCVLPRGSEENQEIRLAQQSFLLRLGQPVRFHLVSSTDENACEPGTLTDISGESFVSLPPLAVTMENLTGESAREQEVQLVASLTEFGTLHLQCVAAEDESRRWDVQFQLRGDAARETSSGDLPERFGEAVSRIEQAFGRKTAESGAAGTRGLRADLEKMLGPRDSWDSMLLRELLAVFLDGAKNRRRSAAHERLWLSMAGYCMRPGFGMDLDDWRIEQFWRLYGPGPQFVNETQNWTEWWTMWRRIAGGLDEEQQAQIFRDISRFIDPASARQGKTATQLKKRSYEDIVRLAGVLERLGAEQRIQTGEWLLKRLKKPGEPAQSWWSLGRIGARVPFHASDHNVLPRDVIESWLPGLLAQDWKKNPHIAFAATMMARKSGDRERDLDPQQRRRIAEKLQEARAPVSWNTLLMEVTRLEEADSKRLFGESLPPGLKLMQ